MAVHEDYDATPCPTCEGGDENCWHCRGSGLMDPDGVVEHESKPDGEKRFAECPECGNLMAHRRTEQPSVYCNRCGYLGFDDEAVLSDPRILEG